LRCVSLLLRVGGLRHLAAGGLTRAQSPLL
jgi:hypothetical protein